MKRKRKSEQENRVRIVCGVNPKFHEQVSRFARALKVSIQELVVQSLVSEMQGFDLRVQVKRTENQLEAVQARKTELVKDRNSRREELKQVRVGWGFRIRLRIASSGLTKLSRSFRRLRIRYPSLKAIAM